MKVVQRILGILILVFLFLTFYPEVTMPVVLPYYLEALLLLIAFRLIKGPRKPISSPGEE